MVRLEVIETSAPGSDALKALKAYAAVSDSGQETILSAMLKRAFAVVQRYADVALLGGRYRITAEDHHGIVKVYMGGKAERVVNGSGDAVTYEQDGNILYVGTTSPVQVEFTTTSNADEYDSLLPVVLRYATALYDGEDTKVLNEILKESLYA
jgi:hypothetical protein